MDFMLTYRGIPIGRAQTPDARGLGVVPARPLTGLDAVLTQLPKWDGARVTAIGARGLSESVEWLDAQGATVPASRIDVWLADDGNLLVFTAFDALAAGVPAVVPPRARSSLNAADADERLSGERLR